MHTDLVINQSHGDKIVCGRHGKLAFHFRAGPVPKYNSALCWCCCMHTYRGGHQGRVKQCYRRWRKRKTFASLKQAVTAKEDGFQVRKGMKYFTAMAPRWWDDLPNSMPEKNWKRYRKTQWKPGEG